MPRLHVKLWNWTSLFLSEVCPVIYIVCLWWELYSVCVTSSRCMVWFQSFKININCWYRASLDSRPFRFSCRFAMLEKRCIVSIMCIFNRRFTILVICLCFVSWIDPLQRIYFDNFYSQLFWLGCGTNSDAAQLAEFFLESGCTTKVNIHQ